MPRPTKRELKMIEVGKTLGYPECCAIGFVFDRYPISEERHAASIVDGEPTGFIPCRSCANKVLSGEIQLSKLIKNRKHPTPFPIEDPIEFKKLIKPLI